MVCILNRKLLATEADPQQLGSVKDKLQQAGIPFSITPTSTRSMWPAGITSGPARWSTANNLLFLP